MSGVRKVNVESEKKHEEVDKTLERHERDLEEMGKRLKRLEIEAGLYTRRLRGVDS